MIDPKRLRGAGGKPSSQSRTPVEAPDSLRSVARAQILDAVSEGEIYGLANQANPFSCVFYDETPVANADGSYNFKDFQIEVRHGTQDQDHIQGFPSVENEIAVGLKLTNSISYTRSLTNTKLDGIRVRISTPILSATDPSNNDITGTSVTYRIQLSVDGGAFNTVLETAITGKTTSKYERSHRIDLPPATAGWQVRVQRVTAESTSASTQNELWVESVTEIIDGKFRYPNTALISHKIDAAQFQRIPARAARLKGRIIRVPSNYNPTTRVYSGVWNGTYVTAYCNNPAWVFLDLLTNDRYGLGEYIKDDMVDKWALYEIAQYCDEMVPDGNGGTEPRFTCNLYLQTQQEAYKVITDLSSVFRGMSFWAGGKVVSFCDKPEDVSAIYSPANVSGGKFRYSGSGRRARHTVALVTYNDLNDFGRQKIVYVEDKESIDRFGINPTSIVAFGCTSPGQARRAGKYLIGQEKYADRMAQFGVGLDGELTRPGQVVKIADPLKQGARLSGRVAAGTTTTATLDKVPPEAEIGDEITLVMPDGTLQKRTLSSIGTGRTVGWASPLPQAPTSESVWMIEKPGEIYAQSYRVLAVQKPVQGDGENSLVFPVTAIKHEPDLYAWIDADDPVDILPTFAGSPIPAAPTGLTLTMFQRVGHNVAFQVLNADWQPVEYASHYMIQWRKDNGAWTAPQKITDSNFDFEGAVRGKYRYRVWGVTYNGIPGPSVVSPELSIGDGQLPVIDLDIDASGVVVVDCRYVQFRLNLDANVTRFSFRNVAPQDALLIEVTNTGNFTIDLGNNATTVNGLAYTTVQGAGAVEILGFDTMDAGTTWRVTYEQPGGADGTDPLLLSLSPNPASASTTTNGTTASAPSVQVTATATGGSGSPTFLWEQVDAGGVTFNIDNPNIANPTFSIPSGTTGFNGTQRWRCTVTDGLQQAQATVDVTLTRTVTGGGGGSFTVTLSPAEAYGHCTFDPGYGGCSPEAYVQVIVSGTSNPTTRSWVLLSGNGMPHAPDSWDPSYERFYLPSNEAVVARYATYQCNVTDTVTGAVASANVYVELSRSSSGGAIP